MPRISIIVPVYNTEKYLSKCIDSILSQSFTDFELLLINDGSKDNSGTICDQYAVNDSRVRVFHKENGGVSSARNLGLENAEGYWITFVDSDDYVDEEHISNMLKDNNDVDFISCNFLAEGWGDYVNVPFDNQMWINKDLSAFYETTLHRLNYMVCKLFKKRIIETYNIRFNEELSFGEDTLFVYQYLQYINSAMTLPKSTYYYVCDRGGSLSKTVCEWYKYTIVIDEICAAINSIEFKHKCNCTYAKSMSVHNCITPYLKFIRKRWPITKIKLALQEMCTCENVIAQIRDNGSWNKSFKRRIFDYLMIHKKYLIGALLLKLSVKR